jgi:hypothetical protein
LIIFDDFLLEIGSRLRENEHKATLCFLALGQGEREGRETLLSIDLETYIYEDPGTPLQGSTVITNGLDITSDHYGKISTKNDFPSIIKRGEYE